MTTLSQNNVLLAVLENKLKALILAFFYILSLFLILRSGVFFQYFTAAFNQGNCYECSMELDYIKHFYFSSGTLCYFFPAIVIFIASLFIKRRIHSYLAILSVIWFTLTLTDVIVSFIEHTLTLSYLLLNVIYNLAGAVFLSFFVCLSNSLIFICIKLKVCLYFCLQ